MPERSADSFWGDVAEVYATLPPTRKRKLFLLVLLMGMGAVAEVVAIGAVIPFLTLLAGPSAVLALPWVSDVFAALGADTRDRQLLYATLWLSGTAIGAGALRLFLLRETQRFVFTFGHELLVETQRRALLQPYSWHLQHNTSEQLAVIARVEMVTYSILLQLMQAITASLFTLFILALLLQVAPLPAAVAAIAVGGAYVAIAAHARSRLEAHSAEINSTFEERIRALQESYAGIRDLILDSSQGTSLEQFRAIDRRLSLARAETAFLAAIPRAVIEPIGIIVIAIVALIVSGREAGLVGALPILGALALAAQRLLPQLQQLYGAWSSIAANRWLLKDITRRLRLPVPSTKVAGPALPFSSSITFRHVSYSYPLGDRAAVADLNFTIPRGSRVALIGRTGSGKSTTADLLMGLLEPSAGEILIDDVTLDATNRARWRANVAHVPQRLFLADATIAQNIAAAADVDMERLRKAAADAQLDEFIASLPEGYMTRVGESGARLSGGQRQRLAIARAIYKQTPVLVLDEATNALDDETERAVLSALDRLQAEGRTIIIISHRGRAMDGCELTIELEGGHIRS
jgi:ATP-binding cassette, subfamily B, bacterial PglK